MHASASSNGTRGVPGTPEPAAGGLGLGLYIARRLAHANHGQLYVTDHPAGHGARLELRLPLASPLDRAPQTSIGDGDETP